MDKEEYMYVNCNTTGSDLYNFIINHMTYKEVLLLRQLLLFDTGFQACSMDMEDADTKNNDVHARIVEVKE